MTQNSISDRVSYFLDNDFAIRRCLLKNIISLRALSRYIIHKLGLKEKNLEAATSAIRRYKKTEKDEADKNLRKLLRKKVYPISGLAGEGLDELLEAVWKKLKK